jgi:integrase
LLNAPEMRVLFTLGGFAGMRLADAALLKWADVLFERGIIAFKAIKTARSTERTVKIPLHPELRAQLEKALEWKDEAGVYVLPRIAERYQRNSTGIKNDVIRVFEKLDYKTSVKVRGRLYPVSEYGFHSLRHTFVSICANRGVPLAIVQELVGHGNPAITRHYFHSDENAAKKAISVLPSLSLSIDENPITDETLITLRNEIKVLVDGASLRQLKAAISVLQ